MILNLFLKSSNQQFEVHLFILNMLKHYMLLVHIFSFFAFQLVSKHISIPLN